MSFSRLTSAPKPAGAAAATPASSAPVLRAMRSAPSPLASPGMDTSGNARPLSLKSAAGSVGCAAR